MLARRLTALLLALLLPAATAFAGEESAIRYLTADDPRPTLATEGLLELHFIDVGVADCVLLRMGERTMLVDCGNQSDGKTVAAYLKSLGIESLTYAFLSHPHNDHLGGYLDLLDAVPVGLFILADTFQAFQSDLYTVLLKKLDALRVPMLTMKDGEAMAFGEALLAFYQHTDARATVNNRSMLTHVSLGSRAVLLAADVENNGQKALAEAYGERLRADILKMPHHGLAAYMREFHAAVKPSLAIFSNNKSRIADTIALTERRGAAWLLTTKGTVVAVTDGETWTVWQESV